MSLIIGAASLAAGILLLVFCLPGRTGKQPAFLQSAFAASLVPVLILSLIVVGASLLSAGIMA